ncbi:hypothetical protein ACQQ2Q_14785 [Agrobacterium sp. ES01]|uniref:hypothetical protein n=1 Tax=Agrobacterium sp. ES01 TaxID=3420714 RepID=UPI003D0FBD68
MTPPISRSHPGLRAVFELAEFLDHGQKLPEQSRSLLAQALQECIADGFDTSLFTALGITQWGGVPAVKKIGLLRRDRVLRRLRSRIPEWASLSPNAAAKEMSASFRRYETTRWPRERHSAKGPAAQPNSIWWGLLRSELGVPGEKRLAQILKAEIQDGFEFPKGPATVAGTGEHPENTGTNIR